VEFKMKLDRETKRYYRFAEENDDPDVGYLYIKKRVFKRRPEKIKLVVQQEE